MTASRGSAHRPRVQGESSAQAVKHIQLTIPADKRYLSLVGAFVREVCDLTPLPAAASYNIQLAVDEAVVNIIAHAYHDRPEGVVQITADIWVDRLAFQLCDWGEGFDPQRVPPPNLSAPQESGYGVYLMRELMDEVVYGRGPYEGSNCVTLIKLLA